MLNDRRQTFNDIANAYDKYRPDYPDKLFDEAAAYAGIPRDSPVLEIGCGTGQATRGFAARGYERVTCIELGEKLALAAAAKFRDYPDIRVVNEPFETWQGEEGHYALAISGTAFHFVQPQAEGYRKVHRLLRRDGVIAFFWTVHVLSDEPVFHDIRTLYRELAPELDDSRKPTIEEVIAERSALTTNDGLFGQLEVKTYRWNDDYSAEDYAALLATHSRHRLLPDDTRRRLLDGIRDTINRHGGILRKPQAAVLFLARSIRA